MLQWKGIVPERKYLPLFTSISLIIPSHLPEPLQERWAYITVQTTASNDHTVDRSSKICYKQTCQGMLVSPTECFKTSLSVTVRVLINCLHSLKVSCWQTWVVQCIMKRIKPCCPKNKIRQLILPRVKIRKKKKKKVAALTNSFLSAWLLMLKASYI